jgi:hypothetical protein
MWILYLTLALAALGAGLFLLDSAVEKLRRRPKRRWPGSPQL